MKIWCIHSVLYLLNPIHNHMEIYLGIYTNSALHRLRVFPCTPCTAACCTSRGSKESISNLFPLTLHLVESLKMKAIRETMLYLILPQIQFHLTSFVARRGYSESTAVTVTHDFSCSCCWPSFATGWSLYSFYIVQLFLKVQI